DGVGGGSVGAGVGDCVGVGSAGGAGDGDGLGETSSAGPGDAGDLTGGRGERSPAGPGDAEDLTAAGGEAEDPAPAADGQNTALTTIRAIAISETNAGRSRGGGRDSWRMATAHMRPTAIERVSCRLAVFVSVAVTVWVGGVQSVTDPTKLWVPASPAVKV